MGKYLGLTAIAASFGLFMAPNFDAKAAAANSVTIYADGNFAGQSQTFTQNGLK